MKNNGIIYLIISVTAVFFTALFVLMPDRKTDSEEITITVMNSGTVTTTQTTNVTTAMSYTTIYTTTKITVVAETAVSSISTNTEPVISSTEPVEVIPEQVCIDINTADMQELMKLDGIGEVTAYEIISYREQNGGFRNIEEIINVYGIGEAKFQHIRDYIYVENPIYDSEEEIPEETAEPETEPEIIPEETEPPEITLADVAPININTAGIELLVLLPHVNEQIAQDIITLRESIGGFSNVYEILYVDKLEQKQVAELVEFVTVGQ